MINSLVAGRLAAEADPGYTNALPPGVSQEVYSIGLTVRSSFFSLLGMAYALRQECIFADG